MTAHTPSLSNLFFIRNRGLFHALLFSSLATSALCQVHLHVARTFNLFISWQNLVGHVILPDARLLTLLFLVTFYIILFSSQDGNYIWRSLQVSVFWGKLGSNDHLSTYDGKHVFITQTGVCSESAMILLYPHFLESKIINMLECIVCYSLVE